MDVGAVVLINLARRTDRLENFQVRWVEAGMAETPVRVLEATDEIRTGRPPDPRWASYPVGSYGCWDSHIRALAGIEFGPVLILEDDAVFAENFSAALHALSAPSDWEVLHLGGQHVIRPFPVTPGLVSPRRLFRSHAYLARYPQLLARQLRFLPGHVDVALGRSAATRYCVSPWLVGQDDSPSDITRTSGVTEFWQEEVQVVGRGA